MFSVRNRSKSKELQTGRFWQKKMRLVVGKVDNMDNIHKKVDGWELRAGRHSGKIFKREIVTLKDGHRSSN